MLSLIPEEYLPYFAFLPDVHKVANVAISLTPLYTYGTACYGIRNRRLLAGFSLDICATMLMASTLRIFYFFIVPYEVSLLRQLVVMVMVQGVLLKTALRYRPLSYTPENLEPIPSLSTKLLSLPTLLWSLVLGIGGGNSELIAKLALQSLQILLEHVLSFFDVHYQRPFWFWQWTNEAPYYGFYLRFSGVFAVLTLLFHNLTIYASVIGITGLFIEALLPLPQILMLRRLQTVRNFKTILLLSWLGGDALKMSYLVYGTDNVSWIFILAGAFQTVLDLVILSQYLYYRKKDADEPDIPLHNVNPADSFLRDLL